jgi:LexA-binding, inner membrane-associated putative hydrolase
MASYRVHLATATVLGAAYGGTAVWYLHMDWGPTLLGAGLTAVGGVIPDLDSDSGIPVRELFGLAAATVPVLLFQRLLESGLTLEQTLVVLSGIYLFIRYGLATVFKHSTVHRGMFHSIPAMLIAGLSVFLLHHSPEFRTRLYLAGGIMLGFLSHLVLDEMYSTSTPAAHSNCGRPPGAPWSQRT